jgi:hypothetical protein
MNEGELRNYICSLYNIDGWMLPELTRDEQLIFVRSPAEYFLQCSDEHRAAIWREIQFRKAKSRHWNNSANFPRMA